MIQHFVQLSAPTRLMAKLNFVRNMGLRGKVFLVLPETSAEELSRVHRLVTAARKTLTAQSIPFEMIEESDAWHHASSGDSSKTTVIDLDLLKHRDAGIIQTVFTANAQVVCYKLRQTPVHGDTGIFARGDSNATLAGFVVHHLAEAGIAREISFVHVTRPGENSMVEDSVLEAYSKVKTEAPRARLAIEHATDSVNETIERCSLLYNLLVFGLPGHIKKGSVTEHFLTSIIAGSPRSSTIFVYARGEEAAQLAVTQKSIEPWILKNTFSRGEFDDVDRLVQAKRERHLTISLVLPALNEGKTVQNVITAFKGPLLDERPLLDEIILMDSNSTDDTRAIAAACGIPVYIHQQVRPDLGTYTGKGETMWKALFVAKGDIIIYVDTDLTNPDPSFITGLVGPLLMNRHLTFVKGFYRRPVRVVNEFVEVGGGRVTELTARPLLNLWYPELGGIFQPLAGTIAAYANVLRELHFLTGYGVEIGHIIEYSRKWNIDGLAQSELGEILHRNQPLEALSKMSFQVLEAFFKLGNGIMAPGAADHMSDMLRQPFLSDSGFTMYQSRLEQTVRPPAASVPAETANPLPSATP